MSRPARCPYTRPFDDRGSLEIVVAWGRGKLAGLKDRALRRVRVEVRR